MIVRITLCFLIVLSALNPAPRAQDREGTGMISGKVTIDGKPGGGILLILSRSRMNQSMAIQNMMEGSPVTRIAADSEGHYQFTRLVEGTYTVTPFAPAFCTDDKLRQVESIAVADGETVDGIDFDLKSGAVITGVVTASDGRPIIGLPVSASPDNSASDQSQNTARYGSARTDDRGVYRIFGLSPGRYRVNAGPGGLPTDILGGGSAAASGFYHDRADASKAGVLSIPAGSETAGIDIKIAPPGATFDATGRVVDDDGRAVPNISILCKGDAGQGTPGGTTPFGPQSNSMGEFRIRGLKSGGYSAAPLLIFAAENEYYGEQIRFEVNGANVTGLEIKVHKGMTASGQVVLEGTDDPQSLAKLYGQQVMALTEGGTAEGFNVARSAIGPSGEFALHGLAPGKLHLLFGDIFGRSGFEISRVELNGLPQKDAVQIDAGQDLTGLKIVVLYANCSIHGRVIVTGGKLPKGTSIEVSVTRINSDASGSADVGLGHRTGSGGSAYADPSGNFKVDGLVPGDYEVVVQTQGAASAGGNPGKPRVISQTVTLVSGQDAELNVTMDLAGVNPMSDK